MSQYSSNSCWICIWNINNGNLYKKNMTRNKNGISRKVCGEELKADNIVLDGDNFMVCVDHFWIISFCVVDCLCWKVGDVLP